MHLMGAQFLGIPELMVTEDEAAKLSDALARVTELYTDVVLPEKTMAWIQLCIVAAGVYGPRYIVATNRMKQEKLHPDNQAHKSPISFPSGAVANA